MTLAYKDVDFDLKIAEFRINGYTVFEDMIPPEKVDAIRDAFLPLLANVQERETEVHSLGERGDPRTGMGRLQTTHRYTLTIPWLPPFAAPEIYEHPIILEFLDRLWKPDGYVLTCYHSNTPCQGSVYQDWHRDTNIGTDIPHVGLETVPIVGVKYPLCDTSEENGSFEVLPATQYLALPEYEGHYDEILRKGHFPSAQRLNLKKGSMWVQDVRTIHRGTPNPSPNPRPELCLCYGRNFWHIDQHIKMPESSHRALSPRGKELLKRYRPVV